MEMVGGGFRLRSKGQNRETPKAETIHRVPVSPTVIYKRKYTANVRIM